MIYVVKINDTEYEVEVEKGKANILKTTDVSVKNNVAPVQAVATAPATVTQQVSGEGEKIVSPMPGTILDIKVSQGSGFKRGETLMILEAMKMENEIVAPSDGVITQIYVSKGAAVNTNDMLISFK